MNSKNILNSAVLSILFLLFALACSVSPSNHATSTTSSSPSPTASASDSKGSQTDDENEKLKEKVAELEKKVEEQEKQKTTPQPRQTVPQIQNSGTTARVNSPGDGFLALRSEPSSDIGYRIVQIPHGEYVRILGCQNFSERVGGRTGRWCRVNYDGFVGWAFDGWLSY